MTLDADQRQAVPDIRTAVMRLARRLRNERHNDQLTPSQMAVVGTLMRDGPQTPAALAATEHVQPPSMTRIVAVLEQGGWVVKQPHPQDRRQVLVELTPQAREWVAQDRQRRDHWLAGRMEQLSETDRDLLIRAARVIDRIARTP